MNNSVREQLELASTSAEKAYSNSRKFVDIGIRCWEQMVARQFDTVNTLVEHSVAQTRLFSETKDPRELVNGQLELNRTLADKLVASSRELVNLGSETRDAYRSWLDTGVAEARDDMEKAVKSAA
jgi:phasin family protein